MKFPVFFLLLATVSAHGQKANLQTAQTFFSQQKYQETYDLLNTESFKYKDTEKNAYNLVYAATWYFLYSFKPEINSTYRNGGISKAAEITEGAEKPKALEYLSYLTETIYADMIPYFNALTDTSTNIFGAFSVETLMAFRHFTIPADWSVEMLAMVGGCFYNDAAYLSQTLSAVTPEQRDNDLTWRYQILKRNAKKYYETLCNTYQKDCDVLELMK